jgi:hypothetical protein
MNERSTQVRPVVEGRGSAPHATPGQRLVDALRNNLFPIVVYAAINAAVLLSVALLSPSRRRLIAVTHGDSAIYLWISNLGYQLIRCPTGPTLAYRPNAWCGNSAWQPLYPWMIKVVSLTGLSPTVAAEILTQVFALGAFILIWRIVRDSGHARSVMVLAAVFPGSLYLFTIYPISLVIFLSLVLFKLLDQRRYVWAMVPAFLIPLGYSSAVAIVGVLGLWWLVFRRLKDWRQGVLVVGSSIAGYVLFLGVLKIADGTWRAEFMESATYGIGIHDPVSTLFTLLTTNGVGTKAFLQVSGTWITPLQSLLVLCMIGLMTYVVCTRWRTLTTIDQLVACYGYVFWVVPLVSGLGVAAYRTNALLVPIVILFRYLPRPLIIALVVLGAPLVYFLSVGVLTGQLL